MTSVMRLFVVGAVVAVVGAVALGSPTLSAQGGRPGRPGGRAGLGVENPEGTASPAEIQGMFDAYALMQAQEQLTISDEQFAQFLTRFKALQDVRRKSLMERARLVAEIRRLLNQPQGDEAQLKDRLKALLVNLEGKPWQIGSEKSIVKLDALEALHYVAMAGPIERSRFVAMTGLGDRTGRRVMTSLLDFGVLTADTPRAPLTFAVPLLSLRFLFPNLWPEAETE